MTETASSTLKYAKPPTEGNTCVKCIHWLKADSTECALVNNQHGQQQWVPTDVVKQQAIQSGQLNAVAALPKALVGPCSFSPNWVVQPEFHWCAQFQPARVDA